MTSRERWTIYPLLFLTLGIAIRDKITRTVRTDIIICKELDVVRDGAWPPQISLRTSPLGGVIEARGEGTPHIFLGHSQIATGLVLTSSEGQWLQGLAIATDEDALRRLRRQQWFPQLDERDQITKPSKPEASEAEATEPESSGTGGEPQGDR